MRLEYILSDFDSTKHNKFNSTYEMLRVLLSQDGVATVTKKFVESTKRDNESCPRDTCGNK